MEKYLGIMAEYELWLLRCRLLSLQVPINTNDIDSAMQMLQSAVERACTISDAGHDTSIFLAHVRRCRARLDRLVSDGAIACAARFSIPNTDVSMYAKLSETGDVKEEANFIGGDVSSSFVYPVLHIPPAIVCQRARQSLKDAKSRAIQNIGYMPQTPDLDGPQSVNALVCVAFFRKICGELRDTSPRDIAISKHHFAIYF